MGKKNERGVTAAGILRNFYDKFGWQIDDVSGLQHHHIYFQDMDEMASNYRYDHELRYKRFYFGGGRYFLDAGCGGEPRPILSQGFDVHLCLDISIVGLNSARAQLGDAGAYVLADLSALPFKADSFNGVLASHCLYHVDKDQQKVALQEFYRVTNTNKFILVFYSSRYNLISLFHKVPYAGFWLGNILLDWLGLHLRTLPPYLVRRRKTSDTGETPEEGPIPDLYSYAHNPMRLARDYPSADVSCLMSFTIYDTKLLRKLHLLGAAIRGFDFLERTFPHAMRYVGKFSCIRIQKRD